jgi:hypothetical protein
MRIVTALLIRGLSVGGSSNPTLFVDGDLDATTLPSPLSTSSQIKGWLVPDSLSVGRDLFDLRNPLIDGITRTVQLQDDADGTLAALFEGDPGHLNTNRWTIDNAVSLTAAATTVNVTGPAAIASGDELYLNGECLAVSATSTTVSGHVTIRQLTVTRGACGSDAKAHQISPADYPPGTDGSHVALTLYSRPQFENGQFEASIYQLKMDDLNPAAVSSVLWAWHGFVEGRPTPGAGFTWTVAVVHATKALADFTVPGGKDIELSHCVNVVTTRRAATEVGESGGYGAAFARTLPAVVKIPFSRQELEAVFGSVAHIAQSPQFDSSVVSTLSGRLSPNAKISREIVGEVGGHTYAWRIISLAYVNADRVEATGVLTDASFNADITDAPVGYPAPGFGLELPRSDGYNMGFIDHNPAIVAVSGGDRVRTERGEVPPKVTARWAIRATFLEALLYVSTSGHGGSGNGSYDLLTGGWPQLDPDWLNSGSAPVSALSASEGTSEILKLNALLNEVYDYYFTPGDTLGEWLKNELLLHCCLLSFVPSTGKLAARLWSRKRSGATALNPVTWPDAEVQRDAELEEIKALHLWRGLDPITLEFEHKRAIATSDAKAKDFNGATVIKIWRKGATEFSDAELASGPLARLARALMVSHLGRPFLYAIPVAADAGHAAGDLVTWTDPSQSTATGRGVTDLPLIVLAVSPDPSNGRAILYGLWDVLGAEAAAAASTGKRAPALKVTARSLVSGNTYDLTVTAPGDGSFNIETSYGAIFQTLATNGARVRILNPARHNPTAANELRGPLEASATVVSVNESAGTNTIRVTVNASWVRGSYTVAQIVEVGAWVTLQRYLSPAVNPEGATVKGDANQDYDGGSGRLFAKLSLPSLKPTYDGRRLLIGA